MRLRYTPQSRRHLEALSEYLTQRNPEAARRIGLRIQETVELLALFPQMSRAGTLPGTREFVVPGLPYVIVHRIERGEEDMLVILGVYHTAQRRP